MWGTFIFIFAGMWTLQFLMTQWQVKQYKAKVNMLSSKKTGFLGTGYYKKRFGFGAVAILISDTEGFIKEAHVMRGLTIFAKFKEKPEWKGLSLEECRFYQGGKEKERLAVQNALELIIKEKASKDKEERAWIS